MCEYCENDKELLNKKLPLLSDIGIDAYITTNHLGVKAYIIGEDDGRVTSRQVIPIKYCPMCGRDLNEYRSLD